MVNEKSGITGIVVAVLRSVDGRKRTYVTHNVVTDQGDLYYAQRAALLTTGTPISPVPAQFVDTNGVPDMIMELYNGASAAPVKGNDRSNMVDLVGSGKAMDSGYPKANDLDADNTGKAPDSVTYKVSFGTAEVNASGIADVILTNPSPTASDKLLMHAEFGTPFTKTSSDTLIVYINHNFLGS